MREELHIVPKKTKKSGAKKAIIPLSERFKRILNKYNGVHRPHFRTQLPQIPQTRRRTHSAEE